jgi:hypothetical protein
MRWQLMGTGWPVNGGALVVPPGAIIEGRVDLIGNQIGVAEATWDGHVVPMPPPLNAMALDNDGARLMIKSYPDHRYLLHFGPGVEP